jgi:hypothetical protein
MNGKGNMVAGVLCGWLVLASFPGCAALEPEPPPVAAVKPAESLTPSRTLVETKCSRCHGLECVYAKIGDPGVWVKTVVTMSGKNREWIPRDEMKALISYRRHHPEYVEILFDGTCGSCHRWEEMKAMEKTGAQWKTLVNYMAGRCGTDLKDHERAAITYALASP